MRRQCPRRWSGSVGAAAAAALMILVLQACKSSSVTPDTSIEALVGDWDADAFVLTSVAHPDTTLDLIALGGTFTINVQPSGQYTAVLIVNGLPQTEIGQVSASGGTLTLKPSYPASADSTSGTYKIEGDRLTIDGETDFDFNLNGSTEPATVHIELLKQ